MVYMIGLFIGSYVIGFASDKFGRKITMMTSLLFLILGGSLAGLMPTYPLYVCCYVVASIAGYGMFVCPFLLTVELLPVEKKTFISMMTNFPFVIGMSLMCLIAWASKDYQLMHLLGYLPLIVFFPLWFILPESPRSVCSPLMFLDNFLSPGGCWPRVGWNSSGERLSSEPS